MVLLFFRPKEKEAEDVEVDDELGVGKLDSEPRRVMDRIDGEEVLESMLPVDFDCLPVGNIPGLGLVIVV